MADAEKHPNPRNIVPNYFSYFLIIETMPKDVAKKSKKMRGGAPNPTMDYKTIILPNIDFDESQLDDTITTTDGSQTPNQLKTAITELKSSIEPFSDSATDDSSKSQTNLLNVINNLRNVIDNLPEATAGGSRKKKSSSKKVKRVGGNVDMSKLYNVSGLIVDSKDPVAVAGGIGPDSTPMPFSANGQGLRYTGGISTEFMNDLNPSLGQAGGAKKKGKGKGKK